MLSLCAGPASLLVRINGSSRVPSLTGPTHGALVYAIMALGAGAEKEHNTATVLKDLRLAARGKIAFWCDVLYANEKGWLEQSRTKKQ